jgi:hypothetical protein
LFVCAMLMTKLVDPPLVNASLTHPYSFKERKKREAPSRAHHEEVAGSIWCPKQKELPTNRLQNRESGLEGIRKTNPGKDLHDG